ncbi:MAG: restriction endonuclease subunit S [Pseudomonadota bacterium]
MSWPAVELQDVADIERSSIKPDEIESGTHYLGLEHIQNGGAILGCERVENGDLSSNKFIFGPRHILYGKLRPYLAKIALPDFEGICSTDILPVLPSSRIDRSYLAHFLRQPSMVEYASSRSTGANLPRLSPKSLAEFSIPLPPLKEQRRIAGILDQADALRRLRTRALNKLNTLGQAIFHEMFGDAVSLQQIRQSRTVQDALDAGHLLSIQDGNHGERHPKVADFSDVGTPFIMANCFGNGELHLEKAHRLSDYWLEYLRKGFAQGRDVLLTHKGTLGETAIVEATTNTLILSPQVTYYRTGDGLLPEYLQLFFCTSAFQALLKKSGDQSTRAYIGLNKQKELPIFVPPISEQEELVKRIEKLSPINKTANTSKTNFEKIFASLQNRAFRGEV